MIKRFLSALIALFLVVMLSPNLYASSSLTLIASGLQYDYVPMMSGDMAAVQRGGKVGFIDMTGTLVIPCIYDNRSNDYIAMKISYNTFEDGVAIVSLNGKEGVINKQGQTVVEFGKYKKIYAPTEGVSLVDGYESKSTRGFVNVRNGVEVAAPGYYDDMGAPSEGLLAVTKYPRHADGSLAYDDNNGGYAGVWSYISTETGKTVITGNYISAEAFHEGLAAVRTYDKKSDRTPVSYIDKTGKVVLKDDPSDIDKPNEITFGDEGFSEGLTVIAGANQGFVNEWDTFQNFFPEGFMNTKGQVVIKPTYDRVEPFSGGLSVVMLDPDRLAGKAFGSRLKFGAIDHTGKVVIEIKYDSLDSFDEQGVARAGMLDENGDYKWGFIDRTGRVIVPLIYDVADAPANGAMLAAVKDNPDSKNSAYTFVAFDIKGNQIITKDMGLRWMTPFYSSGIAIFMVGGQVILGTPSGGDFGFLTRQGQVILEAKHSYTVINEDGRYIMTRETEEDGYSLYEIKTDSAEDMSIISENPIPITPTVPSVDALTVQAQPSNQAMTVNGEEANPDRYNIAGNNYFKLRDLAILLSGTSAKFEVEYSNGSVNIVIGEAYTPVGGELAVRGTVTVTATVSTDKLTHNGRSILITAYKINGANYYKLADLGPLVGAKVSYDETTRTIIVTTE
jgi:hypothetical protein